MRFDLYILPCRRGIDGQGHGNFYAKARVPKDAWFRLGEMVERAGGRFCEFAFEPADCGAFAETARNVLEKGVPPAPVGASRKAVGCVLPIRPVEESKGPKWFSEPELAQLHGALDLMAAESGRGGVVVERTGGGA